jgi:hypothetical protein
VFNFELAPIQASILDDRFVRVVEGQEFYWTPSDALGANGIWWEADSGLTFNTQPTLTNGDFESGTTGWSAYNSVLSAVTASPYEGVKNLRVTPTLALAGAYQTLAIVGNRYIVRGVARSDGTKVPRVAWAGPNIFWSGSTSTDWQLIDAETACSNTSFYLYTNTAGGSWVEFDDITIENISLTQWSPRAATGALAGSVLEQATAADMPWKGTDGVRFDGVGDYAASDAAATVWKFLHDGTGATIAFRYTPASVASYGYLLSTFASSTESGLILGTSVASPSKIRVIVANGSGGGIYGLDATSAADLTVGADHTIVLRNANGSNLTVRLDGTTVIDQAVSSFSSANPNYTANVGSVAGGASAFIPGTISQAFATDRVLSDAECLRLEAYWS